MNSSKILKLREKIEKELLSLIDRDYVLLDIPDHDNIGDNLIWEGELEFLKNVKFQKRYECSLTFFEQKRIPNNSIILFHGGGNFGDIYPVVNEFRREVIKNNLDKKIIIFPQTIHYNSKANLEKDAKIINQHSNLTLCTRDRKSYNLALENFTNAKVLLLPDMAFCIDFQSLRTNSEERKVLVMDRKDGEKVSLDLGNIGEYDLLDWPTFNTTKEERYRKIRYDRRLDKIAKVFQKLPILSMLVDSRYGLKTRKGREDYIRKGVEFFNEYNTIYTTRLHGLILGILMGKDMKVLDNSYGKLTSFVEAWLSDFEKVEIYKNPK